jgi:uncharacterized membrane protein YtjA (UPF0391 family)
LTGFIPALLRAGFRRFAAILFRQKREISRFRGQEPSFQGRIVVSGDARRCSRGHRESNSQSRWVMLSWVVTFLVVALIAGILGFGGIAGVSVEIAKAIFFIAVILFLVSAVVGLVRGRGNV